MGSARAVANEAFRGREETCRKKWCGFGQSCFCFVSSGILFFFGGIVRYIDNSIYIYILCNYNFFPKFSISLLA